MRWKHCNNYSVRKDLEGDFGCDLCWGSSCRGIPRLGVGNTVENLIKHNWLFDVSTGLGYKGLQPGYIELSFCKHWKYTVYSPEKVDVCVKVGEKLL